MKERPILFSAPMVRAILDGSKTQTRRVMRHQPTAQPVLCQNVTCKGRPSWVSALYIQGASIGSRMELCPYGEVEDRLWVRESFCPDWASHGPIYKADWGSAIDAGYPREPRWKPSTHMPRWASRITLEVTDIRVERLQDITNNDAIEEGTPDLRTLENNWDMVRCYQELWGSINGSELWIANPWVWVVSFKRVKP